MSTPTNTAVSFFIQQEMQKYASSMRHLISQAKDVSSLLELGRLHSSARVAGHATIRSLVRTGSEKTQMESACLSSGEKIIDAAASAFAEHRRQFKDDYTKVKGKFIQDVLEPCRGHFPALYHKADRLLVKVEGWRAVSLKSEEDMVRRPKKGDDLQALGYVFHNTSLGTLSSILQEGLTAGSFTRKPIDFGQNTWIAVPERYLPEYQEHDYAGARALEPNWEREKIYSYDDDMNTVTKPGPEKSIPFDLVIVCDKNGYVKNDGLLTTALSKTASSRLRYRP